MTNQTQLTQDQIIDLLEVLVNFRNRITAADFDAIFGEMSAHLWAAFSQYNWDTIFFYATLDATRAKLFADHLAAMLSQGGESNG